MTTKLLRKDAYIAAIDDDVGVLNSMNAILVASGYSPQCFESADEFMSQSSMPPVGCVISDHQMPGMLGGELLRELKRRGSTLGVIIVTGVADVPTAVRIMQDGAGTLLEKPYDSKRLLIAIDREVEKSQKAAEKQKDLQAIRDRLATLTPEEVGVMELLIQGLPNKTVGHRLDISMRTVDRRRQSLFEKMQVSSVAELASVVAKVR